MTLPLLWMPTLDITRIPAPFQEWAVRRFLKSHGGRGHIIADAVDIWPSLEVTQPARGCHWYCKTAAKVAKKSQPIDVTVDIMLPGGLGDPALRVLDAARAAGAIRRLVVSRPPDMSLNRALTSFATLLDSVTPSVWADVQSFGWDAVSYLAAWDERIQISGVQDSDVCLLGRLSEISGRPLMLSDLSGEPPQAIPAAPLFADEKNVPRALNSLPLWGRSR